MARHAASIATSSSLASSPGNTSSGSRQPNAFTLTTSIKHQATTIPRGRASSAVTNARIDVLINSSAARRRRVRPIAQSGASSGNRAWPSVKRLVSSATPATPRVNALSAAVTANVRSKMRRDSAFTVVWSARLRLPRPNLLASAAIKAGTSAGATRTPNRNRPASG